MREPGSSSRLIQRIRESEPNVQAWAWLDETQLTDLLTNAPTNGPLAGLALGVKDIIDVADMPTGNGLKHKETPPCIATDADCVAALRAAGAIPIGKTITAELAYAYPGPTSNPWNAAHTPGGSSSGSAAAVASGMVPAALGTQTGGSVIRPAAYCGVVGFKPTRGLISLRGVTRVSESLDTLGWFTSNVEVAAQIATVLLSVPKQHAAHVGTLRIAKLAALHENPTVEALYTLDQSCTALSRRGAQFTSLDIEHPWKALTSAHKTVMFYEMTRALPKVLVHGSEPPSSVLQSVFLQGRGISQDEYVEALADVSLLTEHMLAIMSEVDIVVTLSAAGAAPHGLSSTGESTFNRIWTLLGWPAIHLPSSWSSSGLPLGVQLIGKPGTDMTLLSIAYAVHELIDVRAKGLMPSNHQVH